MTKFLIIRRKDWEIIFPFFNQYFNSCDIESKYIKVSSSFLREHLRMVKHDKVTDLTDQIRNSYQSLIDGIKNICFCTEVIIEIMNNSFSYKESLFIKDIQESFMEYIDDVGLFVDSQEDTEYVDNFLNNNFNKEFEVEDYLDYWDYAISFLVDEMFIKRLAFSDPFFGYVYYKDAYVIIDSLIEREGKYQIKVVMKINHINK